MYHNYIWWQSVNFISNLTFIQVVRVPAYISTIISAAADEGPDEMMCFPVC